MFFKFFLVKFPNFTMVQATELSSILTRTIFFTFNLKFFKMQNRNKLSEVVYNTATYSENVPDSVTAFRFIIFQKERWPRGLITFPGVNIRSSAVSLAESPSTKQSSILASEFILKVNFKAVVQVF